MFLRFILFGSLLLCAFPALAEVRTLTLPQALELAAQRNYDVAHAGEYRRQVEGRYVEERANALPQLTLNAGGVLSRDDSQKALGVAPRQTLGFAAVNLTQPLYTWGKIGAAIRAARGGLQSADQELRLARQGAWRDVTTAFSDVLLARELQRLAGENLQQKERHREEAQRKFDAGVATDYDILAAGVAVENARPEVIRTDNALRAARDRLAFLLALPEEIDAQGELAMAVEKPQDYDTALATAMTQRPELQNLLLRGAMQEELIRIVDADDKPRLDLKGNAGWRSLTLDYANAPTQSGSGPAWDAGIYLSWPFFDGLRTRGRVAQAESELRSLRIDEQRLRDIVAIEVRDARNALCEAGQIVNALGGTVNQAERLVRMAEKGYEFGVKTRIEVDDAQLNLLQAQSNLARAQRDYLVARANFAWAMGRGGE